MDLSNAGVIQRLVVISKATGGYSRVNRNITDSNFKTPIEPSLNGVRLDKIVGSYEYVLAELKRSERRAANTAEGLLYGMKNHKELSRYWIWCLGQVWVDPYDCHDYALMVSGTSVSGWHADLRRVVRGVLKGDRVLSFPM